ncbi:membrane protein insertase YidC [Cerasibacillus terrae]|uniref:Membrane protein insertase YidC n=1 Tax=Cerasibacillus terrae TaxID=2498845 RepID=A0A5C8NS53_9BACI|nr:membrane protein insertase YidC [Cerasibacillus terrae]TXL64531.1 membrane protein insertase YidC [Cerasibacillus terrae]
MEQKSVFTFLKKYKWIGIAFVILLLAGCGGGINQPINENTSGWFNHYFVYNFSLIIKKIASILNGSYGLSIIVITLVIRLALLPSMLKQTKNSLVVQDKMKELKPELDALNEKYKGKKTQEAQMEKQQEMMKIYQSHQFNPLASFSGCLPLLIQMPILIAFYYAIRRTPEIAVQSFLWFDLGQTDLLLTGIAVVIYFIQFKVSQIGLDEKQRKQFAVLGLISPIMIGVISLNAPAALPLYWTVGGLFIMMQTLISKRIYLAHKNK